VVLLTLSTGARVLYAISIRVAPTRSIHEFSQNLIFRFVMLAAALITGYICARWLERLPWRSLGLWLHASWFRHFLIGSLIGIASLALAAGIAAAGGGLRFTLSGRDGIGGVIQTLTLTAVLFVVAALAEEAMFR